MFEHLKKWPQILVTGPQRSGTRIAAKMIAHDTGHAFVDEDAFYVDSLNHFMKVLRSGINISVQCPALCRFVHLIAMTDQNIFVVMMMRNIADIRDSEARVAWSWALPELIRYNSVSAGDPAVAKYRFWEYTQQDLLGRRGLEVEYGSLESHPLWVPKEQRANFKAKQTSP
jgi:hypothetical protein